jgi:mannose/fructose/N-acetylgalactosamine-specific phosphotransferase system component IIC
MIAEGLLASAVGALFWLDRFQFPQVMLCRPVVCGPVVGLAVGDVSAGLAAGLVFELLWLRQLPVGGYVPPDGTMAAVATATVTSMIRTQPGWSVFAAAFFAMLVMLPLSVIGQTADHLLRSRLGNLARRTERALIDEKPRGVPGSFLHALGLGYLIGFVTLLLAILLGGLIATSLAPLVSPLLRDAFLLAFYAIPAAAAFDWIGQHPAREDMVCFLAGLCGMLVAVALGIL